MKKIISVLFILTCCLLAGCDKGSPDNITTEDALRAASGIIAMVNQFAPSSKDIQSLTTQEFESLHKYEYKVLEISADESHSDISEQLSKLGVESWDCFSMFNRGDKILITCKRRPKSAVNLIRNLSPLIN